MHSLLSRTHQPYIYSQYPIFVAEVASTSTEQLLLSHLKSKVKSKKDQAFLINTKFEGIRGTIFRQTCLLNLAPAPKWPKGHSSHAILLKKHYAQLNREYYGPNMVIDPELELSGPAFPSITISTVINMLQASVPPSLSFKKPW